ncbi:MAG: hypothetical protein AAGD96_35930, partial [Chloroflexota bacterium]
MKPKPISETTQKFRLFLFLLLCIAAVFGYKMAVGSPEDARVWPPERLEIGMADAPPGQRPDKFTMPNGLTYRQQYLSNGAGTGWTNWNTDANFVKFYIQDSRDLGMISVFTWYNICQSGYGGGSNGSHPCYSDEANTIQNNLQDSVIMYQYWEDMKLFFQKAAELPDETVILHVEPDLWGHAHLLTTSNDATQTPYTVKVGDSGHPDLSGLPNNLQGYAQAIFRLRDLNGASNVKIAYHMSTWGVRDDFVFSNPDEAALIDFAEESVQFYQSIGQPFDLTFFEMRDRDAGYYEFINQKPDAWWNQNDYDSHIKWIETYTARTEHQVMLWQLPYGNTKKDVLDNSWGYYQDNIVETLLDESDYATLKRYRDAGVVALIFGQGAPGTTCPCDADQNGSIDDGGYFLEVAEKYIQNGPLPVVNAAQIFTVNWTLLGDGIGLSWNDIGADSYEVWRGEATLLAGDNCGLADNCTQVAGTSFSELLPNGIDERY